jgi:hypothetical protein
MRGFRCFDAVPLRSVIESETPLGRCPVMRQGSHVVLIVHVIHIDPVSVLRLTRCWPVVFRNLFCLPLFLVTHHVECAAILEPAEKGR